MNKVSCQVDVKNASTETVHKYIELLERHQRDPAKKLFHNSLFTIKRGSTTSILSQNNKACNGTNESVKIVISLHCVTPFFPCRMQTTDDC